MESGYQKKIENRIQKYDMGTAFSASDFLDIAEANTVNQVLFRLSSIGKIRRLIKGVYDIPGYSELIKEYSAPMIDKVADALARKYNWVIAPAGDVALNLLHVSTQVPVRWDYVSDGPYRDYEINGMKLSFRHIKPREINGCHTITVMTTQGIRAIGKNNITDENINRMKTALTPEEKEILLREGRMASAWVYKNIKRICGGDLMLRIVRETSEDNSD
jgi:hypothetical protein